MPVSMEAARASEREREQRSASSAERKRTARRNVVAPTGRVERTAGGGRRATGATLRTGADAWRVVLASENGGNLTAGELASECASAVYAEPNARSLTDCERDSLAQALAVRVIGRGYVRRGEPRDVLAYVAAVERRAERFPLAVAGDARRESESTRVPRGSVGRSILRVWVRAMLRESREWRDVASTYAERDRKDRESARVARTSLYSLDYLSERPESGDYLTRAALRDLDRSAQSSERAADVVGPVLLAQGVATVLLRDCGELVTDREQRCLRTALRLAAGEPAAVLAAREGRSIRAIRKDVEQGRTLLRESGPDVRAAVAEVTRTLSTAAGVRVEPREWTAASSAVDSVVYAERKRATAHRSHLSGAESGAGKSSGGTCPLATMRANAQRERAAVERLRASYLAVGTDRALGLASLLDSRPDLAPHLTAASDLPSKRDR